MPEDAHQYIEDLVNSDELKQLCKQFYLLSLYINLNDPALKLEIDNFKQRKFTYVNFSKNDLICIDGFAKEDSCCIILIPFVMRNNHAYNGIKPAVLILQENAVSQNIIANIELKRLKEIERKEN